MSVQSVEREEHTVGLLTNSARTWTFFFFFDKSEISEAATIIKHAYNVTFTA